DQALQGEHAVFVYFTADWCITCKVNEQLVLEDEAIVDTIERLGVMTFRADWTLRDETIRAELARHGKAGVPVYLIYDPSRPERPQVLPELITVDLMQKALERASRTPSR
ncbi:MAG: thiol:disulfide interchange protein, partial [bacterium]|nr:thiol:disulfide interchange protein [bacterium]